MGFGSTLGRILTIATNVFREVIRDRILYLIGFYGLAMALASRLLPEVAAATEQKILLDLGLAAMAVLGLVIAIFVGTGLVNKEIEKRTVFILIAKPVSRTEFIIGKHWGLSAVLAVLVAAMTAIDMGVLTVAKVPFSMANLLLSSTFLLLQLSLITAIAIAFGVFTSSLLATLSTFAVFMMGTLSQDIVKFGKLTKNPQIETMTQGLYLIVPDLSRLDLKNQAVYNLIPSPEVLLGNVGYALVYMVLALAIASLVFSKREF
jgi:ABC-type transport system involved in multi-copper enzyme maturation permease subunit